MRLRTISLTALGILTLSGLPGMIAPGIAAPSNSYDSHELMLARSHFEKGMKLLAGAREAEAEAQLLEAVKIFPEFVDAHVQLGNLSMRRAEYTQALERYRNARQALADLQGLRHAQEMERQRRLQQDIDLLNARIADLRRSQRAADSGKIQQEMVRLEKLERERTNAQPAAETPFTPEVHFLVGTALMKLERFEEAKAEFLQALSLRPGFGEVHNNLAVIHFYRREYADCWEHLHAAEAAGVRVDPLFREELATLSPEPPAPPRR